MLVLRPRQPTTVLTAAPARRMRAMPPSPTRNGECAQTRLGVRAFVVAALCSCMWHEQDGLLQSVGGA